jgi:DNA topoisomerase-2
VSFVNGVATLRGGRHVDHVVQQMCKRVCDLIAARKKGVVAKPQYVKDNLMVFVRATVHGPRFDSQSKETLTTPPSQFGCGKVELSDAFVEKLYKLEGLVERVVGLSGAAADKEAKKTDGVKRATVVVPKLDDAEWAGTAKSGQCTLILTEGDSAKASAVAGLSVVGRQRYGVFPLRGKVMNVCDVGADKVAGNAEISAIKKILGLSTGKTYASAAELRYGRVMLMTDADTDGSHIRGLVMNLFLQQWPSLLKVEGFLCTLLTPIVKAWPSGAVGKGPALEFYNLNDFHKHAAAVASPPPTKYYKGLGTSTAEEARDWFRRMKMVVYVWEDDGGRSREALGLAFDKKRADDRKAWLAAYDPERTLQYGGTNNGATGAASGTDVTYTDFVDKDLVHFSNYDVLRSIPSAIDGLKVSQRKALFGCRKRNLVKGELRVAQLAAYVAEHACFHHGEASMQGIIVCMAQVSFSLLGVGASAGPHPQKQKLDQNGGSAPRPLPGVPRGAQGCPGVPRDAQGCPGLGMLGDVAESLHVFAVADAGLCGERQQRAATRGYRTVWNPSPGMRVFLTKANPQASPGRGRGAEPPF